MELTIVVVIVVMALLLGFVVGNRLAELNLELRERRLAERRRMLNDAAARLRDGREKDQRSAQTERPSPRTLTGSR
jgi:hypothetical protein